MNKYKSLYLSSMRSALILLISLMHCAGAFSLTVYVSPEGKDSNPGTSKAPFASLNAAKAYISQLRKKQPLAEPAEIIITPGIYYLTDPMEFTAEDSGTAAAPLIIRGKKGARCVFTGAVRLPIFQKVSDHLWKVELGDMGKYGGDIQQLFVNGKRAISARTPNEGTDFKVKSVAEIEVDANKRSAVQKITLTAEQLGVLPVNKPLEDLVISVNHAWDRTKKHVRRVSFFESAVYIGGKPMQPWNKLDNSAQFFFEGEKDFLDAGGEFFTDPDGIVFYVPRDGENIENSIALVPVIQQLLVIKGT
ncbi:MAG TPA: hypothetical protein VK541_12960, partial [Pedobacter sp.]|nr:hypothetical protein [Pedobacter sp.]